MQMYYLMKKDPLSIRQVLYMSHVADVCPLPDFFFFCIFVTLACFRSSNIFIQNAVFKWWFHDVREKRYPNLPVLISKSNHPLNLITGYANFDSKNCSYVFVIAVDESRSTLLCRINSAIVEGFWVWLACLRSDQNILFRQSDLSLDLG